MGQRSYKTRGNQIGRHGDDRTRVGRLLCGADRGITDAKDNIRSSLGQSFPERRRLRFVSSKTGGSIRLSYGAPDSLGDGRADRKPAGAFHRAGCCPSLTLSAKRTCDHGCGVSAPLA